MTPEEYISIVPSELPAPTVRPATIVLSPSRDQGTGRVETFGAVLVYPERLGFPPGSLTFLACKPSADGRGYVFHFSLSAADGGKDADSYKLNPGGREA